MAARASKLRLSFTTEVAVVECVCGVPDSVGKNGSAVADDPVGERSLRHVLGEYMAHYHTERSPQGKGNVILFPEAKVESDADSPIECRERLGGLRNYYHRKAA